MKNPNDWNGSPSSWRIIAQALARESDSRATAAPLSDNLKKTVSYWAGEEYLPIFDTVAGILDSACNPSLDNEQSILLIGEVLRGATSLKDVSGKLRASFAHSVLSL